MICFRSSAVWCSSRSFGLTPKRRTIALESAAQRRRPPGAVIARNQFSGRETRRAVRSASAIASIFGTCSPMLMWMRGDEGEGDRHRDADRGAVGEAAEDRLEQLGQRGLAEEADADRGHRDPDLAGRERLVDLVELLDDRLGAALAFLGELLDLAAAAAHERELGRDEEAVDRHQQEQEDEQQDAHRLCGPVLRGRSSSAIRRRKYSFLVMRIASLVPSATEMLFALGLGDSVVARHPRVRLPARGEVPPPPDAHRHRAGLDAGADRLGGEGDRRRGPRPLRARRGAARRARAGPDRHPGGLRRLRGLLRGRGRRRRPPREPPRASSSRTRAPSARCSKT